MDQRERHLLFTHPKRSGQWQVISGAVEREESILDAVLREVREEAGPDITVRPLGAVHTFSYPYREHMPALISVAYLLAYEGGRIIPGDDLTGADYAWHGLADIEDGRIDIVVPDGQRWLFTRAVVLYRILRDAPPVDLEPQTSRSVTSPEQSPG